MIDIDEDRINDISSGLREQLSECVCPIMILLSIEESDLEYIREHSNEIFLKTFMEEDMDGPYPLLLAYSIVDSIYENYGDDKYGKGDIWSIITERIYPNGILNQKHKEYIRDWFIEVLEYHGLREIEKESKHDKSWMRTVQLHSTSRYYSDKFFDYLENIYNNLDRDVDFDLTAAIEKHSCHDNSLGNSFSLLVKESDIFVDVAASVVKKIDSCYNGEEGEDLGRWEEAFNEWYFNKKTRAKDKPISVTLEDGIDNPFLKIIFPKKNVHEDFYWNEIKVGERTIQIQRKIGAIRKRKFTNSLTYILDIDEYVLDNGLTIVDNSKKKLLEIPSFNGAFFKLTGDYVKSLHDTDYYVTLKTENHNLPVLDSIDIGFGYEKIHTKLSKEEQYSIDGNNVAINVQGKGKASFIYANIKGSNIKVPKSQIIFSKHPVVSIEDCDEGIRVVLKDYAGCIIEDFHPDKNQTLIDINTRTCETGKYTLKIYFKNGPQYRKFKTNCIS